MFEAFHTPGMIRTQLSQMPDGQIFFDIARTVRKETGGFHAPRTQYAIALGCALEHAKDLVYAVGRDLNSRDAIVPSVPRAACAIASTASSAHSHRYSIA